MVRLLSLVWMVAFSSFGLFPPMEEFYHPVSTKSEEAQNDFNRGLLAIYSFNYDEAYRCFRKASEEDPKLAIAHWGMALALMENDKIDESEKEINKALTMMGEATDNEKGYIEAFARRYNKEGINRHTAYNIAMKKQCETYPDDPDACVLYAESLMNLLAWNPWKDEKPKNEKTMETISVLEKVLKENPYHPGANHYFVHAIEDSPHPEWALEAARRLQAFKEWGHLLHTSSHIYLRVGNYEQAVIANERALEADQHYIAEKEVSDRYGLRYVTHSLFFLNRAQMWQERKKESLASAEKTVAYISPYLAKAPYLEDSLTLPMETGLYFHDWDYVLQIPKPKDDMKSALPFWHFARAMAYVGKCDFDAAEREQLLFEEHLDRENQKLVMADSELKAAQARAGGKLEECCKMLRELVKKEDELGFLGWYHQNRQTLGAALLEQGCPEEAENVFREALVKLPRNGRSLFGLQEALKAQHKQDYWTEREAKAALIHAEHPLTLNDL